MVTKSALLGAVSLLAAGAFLALGQRPKAPGEDWITLFNGKDLGGWSKWARKSG